MAKQKYTKRTSNRSWDPVTAWYTGWVGPDGSEHQNRTAIPVLLELLQLQDGERVLDLGCGPGILAPHVARASGRYTGVDASRRLIDFARLHHAAQVVSSSRTRRTPICYGRSRRTASTPSPSC